MYRIFFLLFPVLFFSYVSCKQYSKEVITIESFNHIENIPSASGVEMINKDVWMVGDDSPFLYQLDKDLKTKNIYRISNIQAKEKNRVDKSEKADFESIARIGDSLFVLGSGSVEGPRDSMVIFSLNQRKIISKINVRSLFNHFLEQGDFDSIQQINIEGLATSKDHIYFINRGNIYGHNDIFKLLKEDFNKYLEEDSFNNLLVHRFKLPEIEGFLSGLSGGCLSKDGQYLYITSSVEATNNVYEDGEVLGSFIGRINIENKEAHYWPLKEKGKFVKTKLESISIIEENLEFVKFICTSDNDDGTSGVYHLMLNLKIDFYE